MALGMRARQTGQKRSGGDMPLNSDSLPLSLNLPALVVMLLFTVQWSYAQQSPDPRAYITSGFGKQSGGDLDGAIADFTKAIELKPDDEETYLSRGFAKRAKGDLDGAIADFTKDIELKPDLAIAYNNRGEARYAKGDVEGAIVDYTRGIELRN